MGKYSAKYHLLDASLTEALRTMERLGTLLKFNIFCVRWLSTHSVLFPSSKQNAEWVKIKGLQDFNHDNDKLKSRVPVWYYQTAFHPIPSVSKFGSINHKCNFWKLLTHLIMQGTFSNFFQDTKFQTLTQGNCMKIFIHN